ncbi:PepSY domain-containing protein [Arsukibacterium sp.]|uniref:PepSY domain-containing protein n=1 Tax=Arsukibacterium sp. TaxID=1977258 RepID=UPI002FDA81FB
MLKFSRQLHNWLGLILVIQILFWFLSGLVMAIMPIEQVRGEHLRHSVNSSWQQAVIAPATVLSKHSKAANLGFSQQLTVTDNTLIAAPVYVITEADQQYRYLANTGNQIGLLKEADIYHLASAQYLGNGQISHIQWLTQLPQEVKNLSAPLWQVQFNDADNTTFYLDPATGLVQRVRTQGWRLFDFFWMLHIMDYKDRSNFNNPLLIATAAAALLFTLTGLMLLWQRFRPKRKSNK